MYTKTQEIILQTETRKTVFRKLIDWQGNDFESSSSRTPEFMAFARMFRSHINAQAKDNYLVVANFSIGHFYCSGFFKNVHTGKFAYFSISDVRHFNDSWISNILIRTANNEKDYTGGRNQSTTILNIGRDASKITQ